MTSDPAQFDDITLLEQKLQKGSLPKELREKAAVQIEHLQRLAQAQGYSQEYEHVARYIDWIITLPWSITTQDNLSLDSAKKVLDANHYGLNDIKERILELISIYQLNIKGGKKPKAPSILLLGLVGTGKTTMAYSIAQALNRKFGRIPMGGLGDAVQLRGRSHTYADAEPGQIIKTLRRIQSKNPVILLDEIDRVTEESRADIMGVLVELLDPEQNFNFLDHYLDYPFDLSDVLFIASANNTTNISTAVLDRMEILEMPSYSDEQKIIIGKNYVLPKMIQTCGLAPGDLTIDESIWPGVVRPLGFDAGMRTLERTINQICRKVAKLKVEGKVSQVKISTENLKEFVSR